MANHARKGGGPRGSRRPKRGPRGPFAPQSFARASDASQAHAFSLQEEARNTESRQRIWSIDVKLRHKTINFVSAGNLAGTLPEKPRPGECSTDEHSPHRSSANAANEAQWSEAISRSEDALAQLHLEPVVEHNPSPPPTALFFEDTTGSSALAVATMPPPVVRSTSPTPSNSSEEVVLFRGRNNVRTVTDLFQPAASNSSSGVQPGSRSPVKADADRISAASQTAAKTKPGRATAKHRKRHPNARPHPDDEALADYIENIQAQERDDAREMPTGTVYETSTFTQRALGLTDSDEWEDIEQINRHDISNSNPHKTDWDSPQLEAFDNLSTSSEMLGSINRILRKRERSSGVQYLVVFENSNEDEARWLPVARMTQDHDKQLVAAFEETVANVKFGNEAESSESWSDASEDNEESEDDDEDDDEELDSEDEEDLVQRRQQRMSDEKIARLLAKQEELGIDSGELLLFDGNGDEPDTDVFEAEAAAFTPRRTRGKKAKSKAAHGRDSFPSASVMADVLEQDPYNGFDIMDFERPSLRKKKKGRATELPFELSDDDLVAQLVNSWEKDRSKKRLKKQERAELRSQGVLGKKNRFKPDLNAKYNEGMSFIQIREEIKVFLNSPSQSRPFPPMDKRDRAALHQLAAALGLNSRSIGSGNTRFTTLIKTSRTKEFDEISFAKITTRYQNRFLQRMDKRGGGKKGAIGGGGGKYSAVSYRDGDVVGGSAPEIGSDNKGRAMLEKMGWSSGTALGALNNKGILQPVTHVVKTTKTGLG